MTADAKTVTKGEQLATAIDQLLWAFGGKAAVESAAGEFIIATGWRRHPGWGTDPSKAEHVADFSYGLLQDAVRPRYSLTLKGHTYLVPQELEYTEVGNGSVGHVKGIDFMFDPRPVDMPIPSWRVATRQRHFDLTSPLRLVRKLMAPSADVTQDDNGSFATFVLREPGVPPVHIHTDITTGLISMVAVTEEHSPRGDALVEVIFSDYRTVGQLKLPFRVTIRVDGVAVHDEKRERIEIREEISHEEVAVSEGFVTDGSDQQMSFALYSTEWTMTYVFSGVRFYFDLQTVPVRPEAVDIAEGVKIVLGPSHNTLVVEMPDHVVAVEAPLYDEYTRSVLAQVKAAFPGKPLRKVVATHFHYDHIGGIREFVADGDVTVLAGEESVSFFEEVFKSSHRVHPDRFEFSPVAVNVEAVKDSLSLPMADGGTLQLHHITCDHADDMLIAYLSKSKLVFESDIWNPTAHVPTPGTGRGRLPLQLCEAIEALHLDVETIVGGHSGFEGTDNIYAAPYSFLKTIAGL
jgi:glyoxylase-like metal-dependent hydrolase (beta-lactamase superfamily II)